MHHAMEAAQNCSDNVNQQDMWNIGVKSTDMGCCWFFIFVVFPSVVSPYTSNEDKQASMKPVQGKQKAESNWGGGINRNLLKFTRLSRMISYFCVFRLGYD